MDRTLRQYIRNCHGCRRARASKEKYHGILSPLPVPERCWKDITLDFVVELPESNGYNAVLNVVDRLSKMRHCIPCKGDDKGTSAQATAKLLITHVWKLHGLCDTITSDRGPQFIAEVWKEICMLLQIKSKLSTAFHPETDGQTEIVNQEMERYLRVFCIYNQDDWADWLPMAEFSANNHVNATTKMTPFFVNYGFHPRFSFEAPYTQGALEQNPRVRGLKSTAAEISSRMEQINKHCCIEQMTLGQARIEGFANVTRQPAPNYQVGDKVWLDARNIKTQRPSKKLDYKSLGPFEVIQRIGPTSYKLDLPMSMHIHPVFHSWLLRLDPNDPVPGQDIEPAPPIEVDGEPEWEVEEILDSRLHYRRLQYKAKWTNHEPDDTWYPCEFFENAPELIQAFHIRYPQKPSIHTCEPTTRINQYSRPRPRGQPKGSRNKRQVGR